MADLKPIGSEKLKGKQKFERIMEIARFNETIPSSLNETSKSEYSILLADGHNYEIVKEKQGYVIKKEISESVLDYIEPMRNRKYYPSYSQAFKRLNLLAKELNRLNENEEGISLFGEQKKFVLKTPKAAEPASEPMAPPVEPPSVPSPELPPSPLGSEEAPSDEMPMGDELGMAEPSPESDVEVDSEVEVSGGSEGEEQVTFKTIQKLTGKLTQKIRALESDQGMTSEDVKYVINMVLSSLNLSDLTEEDKEDIMAKFEESDEDMGLEDDMGMSEPSPEEDITSDNDVEDVQSSMDIPVPGEMGESGSMGAIFDSIFGESKVDKVISKYFEMTKKEILENQKKNFRKKAKRIVEIEEQMRQVVKMTESIEQELATQKFLEENTSAKFLGKTNKKNLVVENKGRQVKITPQGLLV